MGAKHLTPLIVAILASVVGVYAKMQFGSAKVSELANEVTSFMVVGDWGGSPVAPYTTPGQLAAAAAMAKIAVEQLATFVVSPGGNFYGGLQGPEGSTSVQDRFQASWDDVYNTPYPTTLGTLPWYTVSGAADWWGNVTAEMAFNGTNDGQWLFPDLFYTFQTVVPFSGDTVEFIMIDTMSLIGGVNYMPEVLPDLYYPPAAPGPSSAPTPGDSYLNAVASAPGYVPASMAAEMTAAKKTTTTAAVTTAVTAAATTTYSAPVVTATPVVSVATPAVTTYAAATAAAPASAAASGPAASYDVGGSVRRRGSRRSLSGLPKGMIDSGLNENTIDGFGRPAVNYNQWNWVEHALNSSYADWLIVVGNHPVWSVGPSGPTWALAERLSPMMEAAGVALYIGGKDHMLEHFKPSPRGAYVDYLVVGAGAYFNDTEPWSTLHAEDCPDGALQFQYVDGTGFANVRINHAYANTPGLMKVSFFDASGDLLYDFYKENPRTAQGHTVGNLDSPPAPSPLNANADSGGPMVIISGVFIVAGVGMGLWIAASHALAQAGYRGVRGPGGRMGAETTPLMTPQSGLPGVVNL